MVLCVISEFINNNNKELHCTPKDTEKIRIFHLGLLMTMTSTNNVKRDSEISTSSVSTFKVEQQFLQEEDGRPSFRMRNGEVDLQPLHSDILNHLVLDENSHRTTNIHNKFGNIAEEEDFDGLSLDNPKESTRAIFRVSFSSLEPSALEIPNPSDSQKGELFYTQNEIEQMKDEALKEEESAKLGRSSIQGKDMFTVNIADLSLNTEIDRDTPSKRERRSNNDVRNLRQRSSRRNPEKSNRSESFQPAK